MYYSKLAPDLRVKGNRVTEMNAADFFNAVWRAQVDSKVTELSISSIDYVRANEKVGKLPGVGNIVFTTEITPGGNEGAYLDLGARWTVERETKHVHLATIKTLDASVAGFLNLGIIAGVWAYLANETYARSFDW